MVSAELRIFSQTDIIIRPYYNPYALLSVRYGILHIRLFLELIKNVNNMGYNKRIIWPYVGLWRLCIHSIRILCAMPLFVELSRFYFTLCTYLNINFIFYRFLYIQNSKLTKKSIQNKSNFANLGQSTIDN